jgi:dienelactone hydrolase
MTVIPPTYVGKPSDYPEVLSSEEIRTRFLKVLGPTDAPTVPLNLRVTDEALLTGDIIRQRVEYDVDEGETVPAFHMFKKGLAEDAPGVLSIHGHGGSDIFPVGKSYHCHPNATDPIQYSYRAALEGFRVLAPDALCFGERQAAFGYATHFMDEINVHAELSGRGLSLAWKSVWDNSRAIEALASLGAPRVGIMGCSGGSTQAYMLAAANAKAKASVCFFSFATLRHQLYQYRCGHCLYHYIPGMIKAGIDWDQVVSLIAPRKAFFAWGALDEGTPEPGYRAFVDAITEHCKREGLEPCLSVHEDMDVGHEITAPMMDDAIQFLKTELGES